jgi:two-component system sensor histidine kinase/response regulator
MASIFDHLPKPEVKTPVSNPDRKPRVLVVDDQPINVKLLERKLEREGMEPLMAENGRECVEVALAERPDIILLDVMMPEMDGIEACTILKSKPETRDIPVIFITARSGKEGKLEGLGAGAVDYIVKPIDLDETMARVRTHLRMREYHRENLALQAGLAEARRQAMIGQLTLGLSHNLNNLLGIVVGYTDLMRTAPGNESLVTRSIAGMDKGLRRIGNIISQVLLLGEHARPTLAYRVLGEIVHDAVETFRLDSEYTGDLAVNLGVVSDFRFRTNAETLEVVIGRLLSNAAEATARRPGNKPKISIAVSVFGIGDSRRILIRVEDNGTGLEPSVSESIFQPFISVKADVGAGLGLPLARHAIELLGGTLSLEDLPGGGAAATIALPVISDSPAIPPLPL